MWCQLILSIVCIFHAFHDLMYRDTQDIIVLAERNEWVRFKQTQLVERSGEIKRLHHFSAKFFACMGEECSCSI